MINATKIESVDVAIIGGGIAGIAIAEFLARHSRLSIRVLERAEKLGSLTSGKLEGWFHTGALYAGQDDAQTFINCVNSLEDLINLYTPYFSGRCNIALQQRESGCFTPAVIPQSQGWFNAAPVYLIHPQTGAPEIALSRLRSDAVQVAIQRDRVLGRLEVAYGQQYNWLKQGKCLAPTYGQVEEHEGLDCSLRHPIEAIRRLCQRFDASYGSPDADASNYEILRTLDCSMDTSAILRDLVASALSHGVTFETGVTIDKLVIDRYGQIQIKGLLCETAAGCRKRLKANLFVFAVGEGFAPFLSDLQLRTRLKRNRSAMVVAEPALMETNFVRMSTKARFHFNHFVQHRKIGGEPLIYSMLANSSYINDDASEEVDEVDIEPILESAERYFGRDKLYSRRLFSYECVKTEFISEEEQKRRYSYWIESDFNSNYLCVLPGKFSFFPTVAFQAYQRIKKAIAFAECAAQPPFIPKIEVRQEADKLVAESYPVEILTM